MRIVAVIARTMSKKKQETERKTNHHGTMEDGEEKKTDLGKTSEWVRL